MSSLFHPLEQTRQRPRALALIAALGSVLLLAGCGGTGEGAGDEEEIRAVIEASATSTDPADCLRYATLNMLEQTAKVQGEAAVRVCEETKRQDWPLPSAVTVTRLEIDGGSASAQVAYTGGLFSAQVPVISLVEEDGSWKEDEILEFAEFDRDAFVLEFGRELLRGARSAAEVDAFRCMVRELNARDREELEQLVLDPSPQPLLDLAMACEGSSQTL